LLANWDCQQGQVELGPGDRLILFTDGITEALNSCGEEFQEERLIDLAITYRALSPRAILARILATLREFNADRWNDDATLLVLGVEGDAE
jgi:sigma-B regulation protein RsbU (phosphoserine phosphatase)